MAAVGTYGTEQRLSLCVQTRVLTLGIFSVFQVSLCHATDPGR